MRVLLSVVMLTAMALSGCAGEGVAVEPTASQDPTQSSDDNTTVAPAAGTEGVNRPPVALVDADILNGTAPLLVNFTIEASDLDGDNMTWVLSINGTDVANGTDFPAIANYTFMAGNHTSIITVSDGMNATATQFEIIAMPGLDEVAGFEPVELTQDILTNCPNCAAGADTLHESTCIAVLTDDNGLDCAFWPLDAAWVGRDWVAAGLLLPNVEFYPDCTGKGLIAANADGAGIIPEGAGCAVMFDPVDPVVTARLSIS